LKDTGKLYTQKPEPFYRMAVIEQGDSKDIDWKQVYFKFW